MSERDDVARLVVLAAIGKGKGFAKAAVLAQVSPEQARELAVAAGWPNLTDVRATWRRLRSIPVGRPGKTAPRQAPPEVMIAAEPEPPDTAHAPRDGGCEMCGTCYDCDRCADPANPLDPARGDCPGCGACGPCIAQCRLRQTKAEQPLPPATDNFEDVPG